MERKKNAPVVTAALETMEEAREKRRLEVRRVKKVFQSRTLLGVWAACRAVETCRRSTECVFLQLNWTEEKGAGLVLTARSLRWHIDGCDDDRVDSCLGTAVMIRAVCCVEHASDIEMLRALL